MKSVSLVMPVYNEAEVIQDVVIKYAKVLKKIPGSEFVICEDGSTDGTKEILQRLKKKYQLTLYQSPKRKGAVKGFLNSLTHAKKDIIWFSDSDNTHDPSDVFRLLKKLDGFDMVIGRKFPRKDPAYRLFVSWGLNTFINVLFGTRFHDINSGFRLIKKELLNDFLPKLGTFPACILTELSLLAIQHGHTVTEVPVSHYYRHGSSRAIDPKKLPSLAWGILTAMLHIRFRL